MSEEMTESQLRDVIEVTERERDKAREQRDQAYGERADLVAFVAACYPSVIDDAGDPDWPIVFVSAPAGQMSWHIAKPDLGALAHVPHATSATWDGHDTPEKYRRLAELTRRLAAAGGVAGIVATAAQPLAVTPAGYQGAAAHTHTTACDGFHPIGEQCNLPAEASAAGAL